MKIYIKVTILFSIIWFPHNIIIGAEQSRGFTVQNALVYMRRIIDNFPRDNAAVEQIYEKNESALLIKCAYALYSSARLQILEALREIDNRKMYWQYQRDHQWIYFLTKNPIKWVTGQSQDIEIQNNLDMLESHQGELYTLLGQLLEQGNIFNQGYKTIFVADYKKGYAWVDGLLELLSRIRVADYMIDESSLFMTMAMKLKLKLEGINYFKSDILSDIKETQVPSKLEQNWFKYGALGLLLGVGYNAGGVEKIKNSADFVLTELNEYVAKPVKTLMKEVFTGESIKKDKKKNKSLAEKAEAKKAEIDKDKTEEKTLREILADTQKTTVALASKFVAEMNKKYALGDEEKIKKIQTGIEEGDYAAFQEFLDEIANKEKLDATLWAPFESSERGSKWVVSLKDFGYGLYLFEQLFGVAYMTEKEKFIWDKVQQEKALVVELVDEYRNEALEYLEKQQKQFAGVSKLVLLTPAVLTGALAYAGYQQATTKDYSQIRRALVDINSLFVDQTKPLEDERYGKMVYLLYNLKKLAEKDLPQKRNVRADFLQDLENIESKEFDVAAKRRIVDDMFRKYSFLGLIQ